MHTNAVISYYVILFHSLNLEQLCKVIKSATNAEMQFPHAVLSCCFSSDKNCVILRRNAYDNKMWSSYSFVQFSPSLTISQFQTVKPCVAVTFYRPHWTKWLSKDMPKGWQKDVCRESCMFKPSLKAMTLTALRFRSRPRRSHQTGCAAALLVGFQAV